MTVIVLEIAGFLFVVIAGTLLHFAYQWLGENPVVGALCPVNESVWEHLKLLFFPMLFYSMVEYLSFGKNIENFIGAKTVGILVGMITIVAVFYTYSGIAGTHYLWADILTFIIGVAAAYFISFMIIKKGYAIPDSLGAVLIAVAACFVVFTFFPPPIPLFRDPITGGYGRT